MPIVRRVPGPALVVFALATLAGLYFASQLHLAYPPSVRLPWSQALAINLAYYWGWAAAVPVVVALARRFPLGQRRWAANASIHLAAATLLTMVQIACAATVLAALGVSSYPVGLTKVGKAVQANFHSSFPTYWLILFAALALEYQAKYRDRALRAAQLESRLAEARLDALRLQLNPHFLFNTLNSISSLMYTDVEAADTMMRKLGDLLRLSLDRGRGPEISLKDELDLVERYLDIERVRFEDRLRVRLDVAPDVLDARVPAFSLQPLVENAIRHAIAPRPEGGRLEISARRDEGWVHLAVTDDGPGLPEGRLAEGVGLANTRARLEQLYGITDGLRLTPLAGRGLKVELALPFRTAA